MPSSHPPPHSAAPPTAPHPPGSAGAPGLLAASVALPPRRRLSSQALLGNDREVEIEHSGQLYRLRLTSLGKLILTK